MQRRLGHRRVPQCRRHVVIIIIIVIIVVIRTSHGTDAVDRVLGRGQSGDVEGVRVIEPLGEVVDAQLRVVERVPVRRRRRGRGLMRVPRPLLVGHRVVDVHAPSQRSLTRVRSGRSDGAAAAPDDGPSDGGDGGRRATSPSSADSHCADAWSPLTTVAPSGCASALLDTLGSATGGRLRLFPLLYMAPRVVLFIQTPPLP